VPAALQDELQREVPNWWRHRPTAADLRLARPVPLQLLRPLLPPLPLLRLLRVRLPHAVPGQLLLPPRLYVAAQRHRVLAQVGIAAAPQYRRLSFTNLLIRDLEKCISIDARLMYKSCREANKNCLNIKFHAPCNLKDRAGVEGYCASKLIRPSSWGTLKVCTVQTEQL
jgi:hypothetical protein